MNVNEITKVIIEIDIKNQSITSRFINKEKNDLGILHQKPQSEITRLKKFMDIYNKISGYGKVEVKESHLTKELILSGFLADETEHYIHRAMQDGQIYECKSGWYAKA
jgi:replicative DNA helicase Mcm